MKELLMKFYSKMLQKLEILGKNLIIESCDDGDYFGEYNEDLKEVHLTLINLLKGELSKLEEYIQNGKYESFGLCY